MAYALKSLSRKPAHAANRHILDEVVHRCLVATVSTLVGDEPIGVVYLGLSSRR